MPKNRSTSSDQPDTGLNIGPDTGLNTGRITGLNTGRNTGHASGQTYDHVLVISSATSLQLPRLVHEGSVLVNARLEEVTDDLLRQLAPDCVLTPLVGLECDVLEVAAHLTRLGYQGLLLAVTDPLLNPAPIKAEIRAANPGLRFDLIVIPQDS